MSIDHNNNACLVPYQWLMMVCSETGPLFGKCLSSIYIYHS